MDKRSRTMIIALGVLLLLGGGYFGTIILQGDKPEEDLPPPDPTVRIGNLEGSDLVRMELPGLTMEKNDDVWELTSFSGDFPPAGMTLDQNIIGHLSSSFAGLSADRLVEENSGNLSVYGLDNPSARVLITDSEGNRAEYLLGDMTPSRTSHYLMEAGSTDVYSVSSQMAAAFTVNLDVIRLRAMFPMFIPQNIKELLIESPAARIEIRSSPEILPTYLAASSYAFLIHSPYQLPRGVDSQAFNGLLQPLSALWVVEFVDDNPSSLVPYGLDRPARIFLRSENESLDLLVGNRVNGTHYAKLADAPGVFTLNGLDQVINIRPFDLVNKQALIVGIDRVERLTVTGGTRSLNAEFHGQGFDGPYFLNGRQTETNSFRQWYQSVIALSFDAEYPGPAQSQNVTGETTTVEYELRIFPGARVSFALVPYNRDFYALSQEGTTEFLISRNQVSRIWETSDAVTFE